MLGKRIAGKGIVASVMFLMMAATAIVPSAVGEDEADFSVTRQPPGAPSVNTEWFEWTAPFNGKVHLEIHNAGMSSVTVAIYENATEPPTNVLQETIRFQHVLDAVVESGSIDVIGLDPYAFSAIPGGPPGCGGDLYVVFEPDQQPPVAAFTLSVDGLTVSVDATPSNDPDGTIVAYDWDWGDGSTDTGVTAEHTYVPPPGDGVKEFAVSSPVLGSETPHPIAGTCYDIENNPLPDCTVTVTYWESETISYSGTAMSDENGQYQFDISSFPGLWLPGKYVEVEAVKGPLYGYADGYTTSGFIDFIDVVLEGEPQEPFDVTITLTVTDNDGLTSTWSETVTLYP